MVKRTHEEALEHFLTSINDDWLDADLTKQELEEKIKTDSTYRKVFKYLKKGYFTFYDTNRFVEFDIAAAELGEGKEKIRLKYPDYKVFKDMATTKKKAEEEVFKIVESYCSQSISPVELSKIPFNRANALLEVFNFLLTLAQED